MGGNFDVFDAFQPDRQNLTQQIFKAMHHLVKDVTIHQNVFRQIFEKSASIKISLHQDFPLYGTYLDMSFSINVRSKSVLLRHFVLTSFRLISSTALANSGGIHNDVTNLNYCAYLCILSYTCTYA